MSVDMFALDFSRMEVVGFSILPAFINVILFMYVFFFLPYGKTSTYFSLFLIFLAIGQLMDAFVRLSETQEVAMKWARLDTAWWMFILPFGLLFTYRVTGLGKKLNSRAMQLFIFLPTILLELVTLAQFDSYTIIPSSSWHWIVNPSQDFVTSSIYVWISLQAALMLVLLWYSYFTHKKTENGKSAALLLAAGFSVPFVGGVLAEVLFPIAFGINSIPITTPLLTAFSLASIIAMTRYKMLDFSPKHQWDRIVRNISEGILIVDNDDRVMFANASFCKMLGYTPDELQGQVAYELFLETAEEKVAMRQRMAEREEKIASTYETQLLSKSGKKIWVLTNGTPYIDRKGNVIGSIGLHANIDYLKKAQQEILESKRKLDIFIKESQLSIHVSDPVTKKILYANPAFCEMLGYTSKELINLTLYDIINDTPVNIDERISRVVQEKRGSPVKRQWKTKHGKLVYVLANTFFQNEEDGHGAIFVAAQNIMPLIETENKLIASNNELEFYIYRVSHELRAPLASILGLTNVGRLVMKDKDALEIHGKIEFSAQKLDHTLKALIQSVSIKRVNEFTDLIDPKGMVCEILEQEALKHHNAKVQVSVTEMLSVPIISNQFLLRTIFQGIIENAFKFRRKDNEQSNLNILIEEKADSISITFSDNGIGIAPEVQPNIFDLYFKGTQETDGAGLGLYLVSKSVDKLRGLIMVMSNLGEGTQINIIFPRIVPLPHTATFANSNAGS